MTRVWLASGSPRRLDLLERVGFEVDVRPADVDETLATREGAIEAAKRLALAKAASAPDDRVVLSADTLVHLGERILGKPQSRGEAMSHLRELSGRWHDVTTAFCVRKGADVLVDAVTTAVCFRTLDPHEIEAYVATGEADDKAGSYGIQGKGGALIAGVRGSWTNVMGLPVEAVIAPLVARGATRWGR
jgi:septum formation protein